MSSRRNRKSDEGKERSLVLGRHRIELSNPDKVFFPDGKFTKGDVIDYYRRVAKQMLSPAALRRRLQALTGERLD